MTDPCEGKYDIVSRLRDHTNRDDNDIAEAAAYIERLRAERDEIERLTKERDEAMAQRDDARQLVCQLTSELNSLHKIYLLPEEVAEEYDWDCYKTEKE